MSRIDEVPVYAQRTDQIAAPLYNLWRRARLHGLCPPRLEFPEHPGVAMLLEEREWICVDVRQNDLPILAWVEFEDAHRDALHLPVRCKLNYYHFAASRLRGAILRSVEQALLERLRRATR